MQVKPVKGFEGEYEVTENGEVYSLKWGRHRRLKPGTDKWGGLLVGLCKNGVPKSHKVHRIVAEAFIENPRGCLEVNHKDFNRKNNHVDNLEWVTGAENVAHYVASNPKQNKRAIRGYNPETDDVVQYDSIMDAHRDGFNKIYINVCLRVPAAKLGKIRHHRGYHWAYVD